MPATQRSAGRSTRATRAQVGRLYATLVALESSDQMRAFLTDLLTPVERVAFAKRWQTVCLLAQGRTFAEIQQRLGVAMATITHANRILTGEGTGKGFRMALQADDRNRRPSTASQRARRANR
jgi:uncharacterized protein YerC